MTVLHDGALPVLAPATGVAGWPARKPSPDLLAQGIHVWRIDLGLPAPIVEELARWLDPVELDRASRFHLRDDRRRYVASHAALRALLAGVSGLEAARIRYEFGRHGKPCLNRSAPGADVHFNMAHSDDLALVAFARDREVGVDVERLRPLPDALEVAARFFSSQELADLRTVGGTALEIQAFYNCWTRKEAIVKAVGDGLGYPLHRFSVALLPGQPLVVRWDGRPDAGRADWILVDLEPAPEFAAALATPAPDVAVHCWTFTWNDEAMVVAPAGRGCTRQTGTPAHKLPEIDSTVC